METLKFDSKVKKLMALGAAASLMLTGLASAPAFALTEEEAIAKIVLFANDDASADVPVEQDYDDAGATGVTSSNIDAVNAEVDDVGGSNVNTTEEIQTVVDRVVAIIKISNYSGGSVGRPSVDDYEDADVENSDAIDIREVNGIIADADESARDATDEIQGIVDDVNFDLSLDLISNYDDGDDELFVELFELIAVEGVDEDNIEAMNAVFAIATRLQSNTVEEIQDLVDAELAKMVAIELIANYTGRNTEPDLDDYEDATVVGVSASNLEAINAVFATASYSASNTLEEIQALVNAELARQAALVLISGYAGTGVAPTAQTYTDALVTGVNAGNLAAINLLVAAATSANSDTTVEIQAIVTAQATALSTITAYAAGSTALTVAQYSAAGITGVTATNLAKINTSIAAADVAATDTAVEVQTIVNGLNSAASYWTKRVSNTQAKLYAKNIVGAGKVQFFLNGKEIAWVKAMDATDPKLRAANGAYYLVRTVNLAVGKNVLEVKVAGTQVRRVVYSR